MFHVFLVYMDESDNELARTDFTVEATDVEEGCRTGWSKCLEQLPKCVETWRVYSIVMTDIIQVD